MKLSYPGHTGGRQAPYARRKSSGNGKAYLLFALVGMAIIGLIALKFMTGNCAAEKCTLAVGSHYVVLIDPSDKLAPNQIDVVRDRLLAIKNKMIAGDKLSIYVLTPGAKAVATLLLDVQKPRDGHKFNVWTESKKKLKRHYQQDFVQPVNRVLASLNRYNTGAKTSPLIRALHKIIKSSAQTGAQLNLLIVSDSLEHSSITSFYRKNRPVFSKLVSGYKGQVSLYLSEIRAALKNAKVEQYLLYHPKQKRKSFRTFWAFYWAYAGVNVNSPDYKVKTLKPELARHNLVNK